MDRAIRALVPSGRRREILELFGNRVTWGAIRHWRKGRYKPPQWAIDRLRTRIAPILELEAQAPTGAALMAWLEAHGRRPKEKARLQTGLDSRPLIEKR
jgi:hypothetical protein